MSKKFEIELPPFRVEKISKSRTIGVDRPKSWGLAYLRAKEVWGASMGEKAIFFVVDTEDGTLNHAAINTFIDRDYSARFTNENPDVKTGRGHGLHVADTVAQLAPKCRIAFIKSLTNEGSGYFIWVANGIRHAVDIELKPEHQGFLRIIVLSLGSNYESPELRQALEYAKSKGAIIVAASGNDGKDVDYPGAFSDLVVTVAAIDRDGVPADFSSPGPQVDLAAPGVHIQAAYKNGYASLSGTSMATPHVAAIISLIPRAKNFEQFLKNHATDIHEPGKDDKTGFGVPFATNYYEQEVPPPPNEEQPPSDEGPKINIPNWVYWVVGGAIAGGLTLYLIL